MSQKLFPSIPLVFIVFTGCASRPPAFASDFTLMRGSAAPLVLRDDEVRPGTPIEDAVTPHGKRYPGTIFECPAGQEITLGFELITKNKRRVRPALCNGRFTTYWYVPGPSVAQVMLDLHRVVVLYDPNPSAKTVSTPETSAPMADTK